MARPPATPPPRRPAASRGAAQPADGGWRRYVLAPALLIIALLLASLGLIGSEPYQFFRVGIAVLALISLVFIVQARAWWWLPVMAAIAVVWNPLFPLDVPADILLPLHYVAAIAALFCGFLVKTPAEDAA